MKSKTFILSILASFVFILVTVFDSCKKKDDTGSQDEFVDPRDGQSYKTVVIGTQTWFAENLNYESSNSWHYLDDAVNGNIYGRLYTWESALTACPNGWHLASDNEWKVMEMFLGMSQEQADGNFQRSNEPFTTVGRKLKSISGWFEDGNGDNSSGFIGLPGGYRASNGGYDFLGKDGSFWTSTDYGNLMSNFRQLHYSEDWVFRSNTYKDTGYSVRCMKD